MNYEFGPRSSIFFNPVGAPLHSIPIVNYWLNKCIGNVLAFECPGHWSRWGCWDDQVRLWSRHFRGHVLKSLEFFFFFNFCSGVESFCSRFFHCSLHGCFYFWLLEVDRFDWNIKRWMSLSADTGQSQTTNSCKNRWNWPKQVTDRNN